MRNPPARRLHGELKTRIDLAPLLNYMCSIACGTVFRRIQELVEDTQDASLSSSELDAENLPKSLDIGTCKPPRKRKREQEDKEDGTLTNIKKFRRIQLISTAMTFEVASNRSRLKVYELIDWGWADKGAGYCTTLPVL